MELSYITLLLLAYLLIAIRISIWHYDLAMRMAHYFKTSVALDVSFIWRPLAWPYLLVTEPTSFVKHYMLGQRPKIELVDSQGRVQKVLK